MASFSDMTQTIARCARALTDACSNAGFPDLFAKHLDVLPTATGHDLLVDGKPFPKAHVGKRWKPHGHTYLAVLTSAQALANALAALSTALHAFPAWSAGPVLDLHVQLRLSSKVKAGIPLEGDLCIETAAVCASGGARLGTPFDFERHAALLGARLDAAQAYAARWNGLPMHTWHVRDLPDRRGPGGRVREVLAPTPDDALHVDIWWNWREDPKPEDDFQRVAVPA